MSSYQTIQLTREGSAAILTLNRPDKLNALNAELLAEARDAVAQVHADLTITALIITGAGRAFCAGADLSMLASRSVVQTYESFRDGGLWQEVEDLPQPTIAAVGGFCFGGGLELAMACDLRIATENAQFGQPEIKVGIFPGAGGTQRLPRLVGMTKAKEMILLGDPIGATEAHRIGLINKIVPNGTALDEARAWADKLAQLPPVAVRMAKSVMNDGRDRDLLAALEIERLGFSLLFATNDRQEGMQAFLEKRKAVFRGE